MDIPTKALMDEQFRKKAAILKTIFFEICKYSSDYIDIQNAEKIKYYNISTDKMIIITSSISSHVLMLYNFIEGSINDRFKLLYYTVNGENILYPDASHQMQLIWLENHYSYESAKAKEKGIQRLADDWNRPITIYFTSPHTNYSMGTIRRVLRHHGVRYNLDKSDFFDEIALFRNKCAHGDIDFTLFPYSIKDLFRVTNSIYLSVYQMVTAISSYIDDKRYLKISQYPDGFAPPYVTTPNLIDHFPQ
ncbi:MAG: hypothetical protein LBT59_30775 [Clostridiales bacterium]|nr:hypothetical protein [Clostridiales bacterium]